MAGKAVVGPITQINGGGDGTGGVVAAAYVLLDEDNSALNSAGASTLFDVGDTIDSIQGKLLQNIRDNNNDQTIIAAFL